MVVVLEQQTWVTLLGFAGFGLALMGYLASMKRELKGDNTTLRSELKADIADLRTELKTDIADLKTDLGRIDLRLVTLENHTYDISARLPPAPAASHTP